MSAQEFKCNGPFEFKKEMKTAFDTDGLFIVRNFLDESELAQIWKTLDAPNGILKHSYQLLGGEVYHYSSMFIMKDAKVGGAHLWHQDYGYWYNYGCLFPDMMTVWIPLDKTTRENSCKKVLLGSQRCGRIDHVKLKGNVQYQADPDRVTALQEHCPLVYLEMEPGDAFFHHCNLVHGSGPNTSDRRRWAFMACFNKATNNPVGDPNQHPCYTPLTKVRDDEIRLCRNYTDFTGKEFVDPTVTLH